MSNPFRSNKAFLFRQLKWIGLMLGINLPITILLPFPVDLVTIILVMLTLFHVRLRFIMRKMGFSDLKQMFDSFSESIGYQKVKYYCMNCDTEHRKISCPRCGSKMKRVG